MTPLVNFTSADETSVIRRHFILSCEMKAVSRRAIGRSESTSS